MVVSIERTTNGAVRFLYGTGGSPFSVVNPTNVIVKKCMVPLGMPRVNTPAIRISFEDGRGSQTILFRDLLNINGTAKPANIDDSVLKIINEVFNKAA